MSLFCFEWDFDEEQRLALKMSIYAASQAAITDRSSPFDKQSASGLEGESGLIMWSVVYVLVREIIFIADTIAPQTIFRCV